MKRYINAYMDKCLLNTLYRYLLNAYIDKYPYKRLLNANINVSNEEVHKCLNTYIDKYSYRCSLNTYINVSNEEVYKCLNTYIDTC